MGARPSSPTTPAAILRLTFIRHAQSEMNLKTHLVCGRSNHSPLTEKGRQQALLAADRLALQLEQQKVAVAEERAAAAQAAAQEQAAPTAEPATQPL